MKRPALRPTIIIAFTMVAIIQQASGGTVALRTVALTGQQAPGTESGVTF